MVQREKTQEEMRTKKAGNASWKKINVILRRIIYFCFVDYTKASDCVDHNRLWKILKEMGISDHITCLLRNLYAGQDATVRPEHGTMKIPNWERSMSKLYCHPLYVTYMQNASCKMLGWISWNPDC